MRHLILSFVGLGITLAIGAEPAAILDLNAPPEGAVTRYYGSTGTGTAGVPVSGGLDCDGDGFKDQAFAQIQASPLGRTRAGTVTVIFGDGTIGNNTPGLSGIDTVGFQTGMLKIAGAEPFEITGAEIWMEDVDGDGWGDLLIGRQNHSINGTRIGAGALTILFGSPTWRDEAERLAYLDLANPPASMPMVTVVGASPYDRLGIWMRAGDLDGDGLSDIVVGADQVASHGLIHAGAVYVLRGGSHLRALAGSMIDLGAPPEAMAGHLAKVEPPRGSANHHFGATVQVGDLDGNGRVELLAASALNRAGASLGPAGSFSHGSGGTVDGTLYIAWDENFPSTRWPVPYQFIITEPLLGDFTEIAGQSLNGSFGEEIIAGDDYSGDGFPDLFVGDLVGDPLGRNNAGIGNVFYTAALLRGRSFTMNAPPADLRITNVYGPVAGAIGADTMASGDFDGDGFTDLACGNPHDSPLGRAGAGSVNVFYGQPGGWPDIIDLAPGALPEQREMRIAQINGAVAHDTLCYSAASGDMNGDGKADFIVNEMTGNGIQPGTTDVGNLLIISGPGIMATPTATLQANISTHAFGVLPLAAEEQYVLVTVRNVGLETLAIDGLAMESLTEGGNFSLDGFSGNFRLSPSGSAWFVVSINPSSPGMKSAALVIHNSADAYALRVGFSATVAPPVHLNADFVRLTDAQLLIQTESALGYTYELERSVDLKSWAPIARSHLGTGGPLVFGDPTQATAMPRFFYQIVALPLSAPSR